jgi:arsenite methyltransferase
MRTSEDLKKIVREKYAEIARPKPRCGCGCGSGLEKEYSILSESYDVVISNCVLNLVLDKHKSFAEIFRVLKQKGHFCVSDIILEGVLPSKLREAAELYAGCVTGAMQKKEYLNVIRSAGFKNIQIKSELKSVIPEDLMLEYITPGELAEFKKSGSGIFSLTVTAE